MALCENCLFYNKNFDELNRNYDDVQYENQKEEDKHFCMMFRNGIDSEVYQNKAKCKHFITNDKA